jgi:hypothetical protein
LVAAQGEYYYTRFTWYSDTDQTPGLDDSSTNEVWVGLDDSGRLVSRGEEPTDETFEPGDFPGQLIPELSNDPQTLLQQLIQRGSEGGDSPNPIATTSPGRSQETTSLLRTLQDLLGFGSDVLLTPEQTAAAAEAAGSIEGVATETAATDPLGRSATELRFVVDYNYGAGSIVSWYFDPGTGQFLGETWRDTKTDEIQRATIIEMAGIATSSGDRPVPQARYVQAGDSEPTFLGSGGSAGQVTPSPEAA